MKKSNNKDSSVALINLVEWLDGTNNIQSVNSFKQNAQAVEHLAENYPALSKQQLDYFLRYEPVLDEQSRMWVQLSSSMIKF